MLELDRIYNMDCLEGMKQIQDNSIDLTLTDPPYCINKDKIINDDLELSKYRIWLKKIVDEIDRVTKKAYFIFLTEKTIFKVGDIFTDCRLFASCNNFSIMGRGMPYAFTPIIFKIKTGFTGKGRNWFISNTASMKNTPKKIGHPTPKPIDVLCYIINLVNAQIVLDPFMGSGSTALACKKLDRRFIGFEIDKNYCNIAKKRLYNIPLRLEEFQT